MIINDLFWGERLSQSQWSFAPKSGWKRGKSTARCLGWLNIGIGWSKGRGWVSRRCSFKQGFQKVAKVATIWVFETELWVVVVGYHNFRSFGEIPTDNIHHNPETWSMSQKDETQNIRGFSYSNIWVSSEFGECVFQKRHSLFDWNKVISWKNVSKMEDTKRSLAGHLDQRKKARFCFGPGRSNGLRRITPPSLEEWGWINSIHPNSSWRASCFCFG